MTDENERSFVDCLNELEDINNWISNHKLDSNVKYLVSYSVIKASGTIEFVFKALICDYLSQNAIDDTQAYLETMIVDSSCNPNTGNIQKMLDSFDPNRKKKFEDLIKGTNEKSDLNSLVNLRNDLAHGRSINTSINTVIRYFNSGRCVVNFLDSLLFDFDNASLIC